MVRSALVDVVPSAAHVDERLLRALGKAGASAIAPSTLTVDALLGALHAALLPGTRVASRVLVRIAVAGALRKTLARRGSEQREHFGAVDGFVRAFDALQRHALCGDDVARAVDEVPSDNDPARARLRVLADVVRGAEAALEAKGFVTRASAERRISAALAALAEGVPLPAPLGVPGTVVRVRCAHSLDPVRVDFWLALARALRVRGGWLDLHAIAEPRRERIPPALDRALRAFEAEDDAPVDLSLGLRDPDAPAPHPRLCDFVNAMGVGAPPVVGAPLTLAEAQGPDEQARWVAARVERWLADGYAPHEIAVVLREGTPEALAPIARALDEAKIPWREECGAPLISSSVARAALSLPRLLARGAPREEVAHALAVLGGQSARAGRPPPYRVAHALRQIGVESFLDPELYERMDEALARGMPEPVALATREIAEELWALLPDADVATHAARLMAFLERAGCAERALSESHAVMASAGYDPGAQSILRAISRHELALRATLEVLGELPALVACAGREGDRVSIVEFAELLADVAAERSIPAAMAGASAVLVAPAMALVGRSVRALAVVGLNEGGFPARTPDETILGDVERDAILRATGRTLWREGGREEETLLFLSVIASATDALALAAARHDAGGRLLPSSPFMVDARRAAGVAPVVIGSDPLARSPELPPRGAERAMRAWVQMRSEPPEALAAAVRSARMRTAIERERRDFFAGRLPEPGRYSGRIDHDDALVQSLGLPAYGSARRPVDVTTLERAARCGFRAFAQDVLRLEAPEEARPTIDAKSRGHLLHALVEAGQDALKRTRGRDPLVQIAEVSAALDAAGQAFIEAEVHADPALLRADIAAIRSQVEAWLARRMAVIDRWEMLETEVAFGPEKKWPALEVSVDQGESIVIHGRIDSVERMDGTVRVVEFKSGRGDGYAKRLREGALDTQFQLIVYTAALARASRFGALKAPPEAIDGLYVGFRDLAEQSLRDLLGSSRRRKRSLPLLDLDALLHDADKGQGAIAVAVRDAIVPLRRGVFPPRPRGCEFCDVSSLCRIEEHDGAGDD